MCDLRQWPPQISAIPKINTLETFRKWPALAIDYNHFMDDGFRIKFDLSLCTTLLRVWELFVKYETAHQLRVKNLGLSLTRGEQPKHVTS